jgi:hypothetical protein
LPRNSQYICAGPIGDAGAANPPRLIQATLKPKCFAPVTSKLLDETNSTSSVLSLSFAIHEFAASSDSRRQVRQIARRAEL